MTADKNEKQSKAVNNKGQDKKRKMHDGSDDEHSGGKDSDFKVKYIHYILLKLSSTFPLCAFLFVREGTNSEIMF